MPKAQEIMFGKKHYAVLEALMDGCVHFPRKEARIYENPPISQNEEIELILQMADPDLPLVSACGGDFYFHAKINPLGRAFYQETRVSDNKESFTNPETYEPVTLFSKILRQDRKRQERLDELKLKLEI